MPPVRARVISAEAYLLGERAPDSRNHRRRTGDGGSPSPLGGGFHRRPPLIHSHGAKTSSNDAVRLPGRKRATRQPRDMFAGRMHRSTVCGGQRDVRVRVRIALVLFLLLASVVQAQAADPVASPAQLREALTQRPITVDEAVAISLEY